MNKNYDEEIIVISYIIHIYSITQHRFYVDIISRKCYNNYIVKNFFMYRGRTIMLYYVEIVARSLMMLVAIGLQADCIKNAVEAKTFTRNIMSIFGFITFGSLWCCNYIIVQVTVKGVVQIYQVAIVTLLEIAISSLIGLIMVKNSHS